MKIHAICLNRVFITPGGKLAYVNNNNNKNNGQRINEMIRVREVRLIDDEGNQLGIVATQEALKMAKDRDLDLVEVSPNALWQIQVRTGKKAP